MARPWRWIEGLDGRSSHRTDLPLRRLHRAGMAGRDHPPQARESGAEAVRRRGPTIFASRARVYPAAGDRTRSRRNSTVEEALRRDAAHRAWQPFAHCRFSRPRWTGRMVGRAGDPLRPAPIQQRGRYPPGVSGNLVLNGSGIESAGELALVWEEGDAIAGFVCTHDFGFRAYLSELIVARSARGRGIGRRLVERVQAELARRGRRVLIADVWHSAEPFYRSLGWQPPDVVLLRRALDPARAE